MTTTNTRKLKYIVKNEILTEAIENCDFYLHYNDEKFILSDGFMEDLNIPEMNTFISGESLHMILKNSSISNLNRVYYKKITIKNVTKPELFNNKPASKYGVLGDIFSADENLDWCFDKNNDDEIVFVNNFKNNETVNFCDLKIKNNIDFDYLKKQDGKQVFYLSYTIQYFFRVSDEIESKICVFDPLIRITNGA